LIYGEKHRSERKVFELLGFRCESGGLTDNGRIGKVYNIGGHNEKENIYMV